MKIEENWPMGMPVSYPGKIIFIGDSPGNSPSNDNHDIDYTPTHLKAHPGFYYSDTSGFWDKIRVAADVLATTIFGTKGESEALAISGLLNCGISQCGDGRLSKNDAEIIAWMNGLIANKFGTQVIMLVGIGGKLKSDTVISRSLLKIFDNEIDWKRPQYQDKYEKYSINFWERAVSGRNIIICTSPNHPSRHPFTGAPGIEKWKSAMQVTADRIADKLKKHE